MDFVKFEVFLAPQLGNFALRVFFIAAAEALADLRAAVRERASVGCRGVARRGLAGVDNTISVLLMFFLLRACCRFVKRMATTLFL